MLETLVTKPEKQIFRSHQACKYDGKRCPCDSQSKMFKGLKETVDLTYSIYQVKVQEIVYLCNLTRSEIRIDKGRALQVKISIIKDVAQ